MCAQIILFLQHSWLYCVSVQRYLFVLVDDIGNFIFIVKNVQGKEVIGEELVIKCWVKNKR